jgi:hypothetical protein
MLSAVVSFLAVTGLAVAAPTVERQSGVQVINNCYQQGQVALTFDGEYLSFGFMRDSIMGIADGW